MFSIETTRNGKPNIVFKNHKYREYYTVKTGEIVWRCLGRKCAASIKTDADRTSVTVTQSKHTGPHPVTLRRLSSSSPAATIRSSSPSVTPAPATPVRPDAPSITPAPAASVRPATPASSPSPPNTEPSTPASGVADLVAENKVLQNRVLELNEQLKCVLDHSIESDTRLLQYTDQVFVANNSRIDTPVRASAADCGVQCELPLECRDQRCAENRDLVGSLRTTIEVLEAEIKCLREEALRCECSREGGAWTVQCKKRHPIDTANRFEVLNLIEERPRTGDNKNISTIEANPRLKRKKKKRGRPKIARSPARQNPHSASLSFSSILINGDSHSRGLAGLLQRMVGRETVVEGSCKPGAKLLSVTSDDSPPAGTCCVIIAGTNDVAAGQQCNIYRHLERRITSKLKSARVVVSTLPHRHDLPTTHPVNLETARVNSYIEELCVRHSGTEVLDFNLIGRDAFTPHGMHLKPSHKHLLAELLLDCVRKLDHAVATATPPPVTVCEPPPAPASGPPTALTFGPPTASTCELPTASTSTKNCMISKTVKIG